MKRRSFFTALASSVASIYIACHVKPVAIKELISLKANECVINPAWVDAPYEVGFLFSQEVREAIYGKTPHSDDEPMRFTSDGVPVTKYIYA